MPGTSARRLAQLAQDAGGSKPFYMRRPIPPRLIESFPAEGWYWTPPGHHVAVFLGYSEINATVALHRIIERQERDDAQTG